MTLAVDAVSYAYPNARPAVRLVSMDLASHAVTGVVGANGCGKSTLLKLMLGLLKPSEGKVVWQNTPLTYAKSSLLAYRQHVTMVFQEPDQQIFYTDVYNDLAFSLRNLGMDEDQIRGRIVHALSLVDGLTLMDKPVQYLSYGQKKRVAIAGALVLNSDYLLLDEPTAGLDPSGTSQMKSLIHNLAQHHKHIVLTSHDINLIYELCDYIYVMSHGQVVLAGEPGTVFLNRDWLESIGLEQPWLVRIHQQLDLPLFRHDADLEAYAQTLRRANESRDNVAGHCF